MDFNKHLIYKDGHLLAKYDRENNLTKAGDRVGHDDPTSGYRRLWLYGKRYQEHRVIWEMLNGEIPEGFVIDHINGDMSDNRIENLRLATPHQNAQNRKTPSNSKSGVTGVGFRSREQKWCARININGRRVQLGLFNTFEEAVKARKRAEKKYYGEFSTDR